MKIGQMTLQKVSEKSDYIQLDVCGLNVEEAIQKYEQYKVRKPIIIHGDWTKKGASENDLLKIKRQEEYINMIISLKEKTEVLGITIHPPFRNKTSLENFIEIVNKIKEETDTPVFIENRSNQKIWISKPEEIISLSHKTEMTIDIPQLYISCNYDEELMWETLHKCCWSNIKEIHLANIMRKDGRSYVARKLYDGVLDLEKLIPFLKRVSYITFEVLGGIKTFEEQVLILEKWINN